MMITELLLHWVSVMDMICIISTLSEMLAYGKHAESAHTCRQGKDSITEAAVAFSPVF